MKMSKSAILISLVALASYTAASRRLGTSHWKPPTPTEALEPHARAHPQISPRPTDSPLAFDADNLRKRASASGSSSIGSNTCGFWTDDGSAFYCDPAYTCKNSARYRGCCIGAECATSSFPTVCYGATEIQCRNPGPETLCCTHDINYPYCVTYLWATTASPNQIFSLFNCDTHRWAGQQILSAEPLLVTTTDAGSAPTVQATVPANNGNANDNTISITNGGGGTPVGAIVGVVIGGLALVGVVVLSVVFMLLRYRKAKAARLGRLQGQDDEAALLSGGAGSSSTSSADHNGSPPLKAEEYGTPMTQIAEHPRKPEASDASLVVPEDALAGAAGTEYKRLSELGAGRRSGLTNGRRREPPHVRMSELGDDRRAELPT